MDDQIEHSGSERIQFQKFLAEALLIIKSKPFVNIDEGELNAYAQIIQYKVQRDFYELYAEGSSDAPSWEDFSFILRTSKELQNKSTDIICRKLETAFFDFDFTEKEICFFSEDDIAADDKLHGALLFSSSEGIFVMSLFLFFAEQAHFNHLQNTIHPDYEWEEYFYDLQHNGEMWKTVLTAFRDAIQRLDFKADWLEVETIDG